MIIKLFDQNDTEFAHWEMESIPRKDDTIEIGFPDQSLKHFTVWRVLWKMVAVPAQIKYVEGEQVTCRPNVPWRWDAHLYGCLFDPAKEVPPRRH